MLEVSVKSISTTPNQTMALVSVSFSANASPGQFYMVKHGDFPIVPRPYSVFFEDSQAGVTTFLVKARGLQTSRLVGLRPGDRLQVRGPLGTPFPEISKAVLVAGGCGFAPLHFYARVFGYSSFFLGTETADEMAFLGLFDDLKCTSGKRMITELFAESSTEGPVIACGPASMLRKISETGRKDPVYVSLESRMACGTGMCLGCPVKMTDGRVLLACKEGPLFNAKEVDWLWST